MWGKIGYVFLLFLFGCWLAGQFSLSSHFRIGFGMTLALMGVIHSISSTALLRTALKDAGSPRIARYSMGVVAMPLLIVSSTLTLIGVGLILMQKHLLLLLPFCSLICILLFYSLKAIYRLTHLPFRAQNIPQEKWSASVKEVERNLLRRVLLPTFLGGVIVAILLFYLYNRGFFPSFWWFILYCGLYGYIVGCAVLYKFSAELEKLHQRYSEEISRSEEDCNQNCQ